MRANQSATLLTAVALLLTQLSAQICAQPLRDAQVRGWAEAYFQRYADRDDWQGFLDQYAAELEFEDPLANMRLVSREEFRAFYYWPDPAFSKHPEYPQTLVLDELLVQGRLTIGRGYFTPFKYQGFTYGDSEPMRFAIWLTWNREGKIVKQVDWIDYPAELIQAMYCGDET
jgi:hypothetical protein